MERQTVVRTYPSACKRWKETNFTLRSFLEEGWHVVKVDSVRNEHGETFNDYILKIDSSLY